MRKDVPVSQFLDSMIARAKADKKTIVLPEGNDIRTLKAAEAILAEGIADPIVLGDADDITAAGCNLEGARIVDFRTSELREPYAEKLAELRAAKGMTLEQALELMDNELYFGMMMVKMGEADGLVSGACHSTGDVLRPALQILKTAPGAQMVSSFFVMNVPDCDLGHHGTFIFSDCGLEVQPNADRLAQIAINAEAAWRSLFADAEPVIAMLSHSSYGSAKNDDSDKVVRATAKVKELVPELAVDGELQLDAAIVPEIGAAKAPASPVAGRANVLVFPDIDAGNIGYKLVQRLAKAEALGPILQGIAAPVNDLSRGCSADDIVGVVAITAVQAQGNSASLLPFHPSGREVAEGVSCQTTLKCRARRGSSHFSMHFNELRAAPPRPPRALLFWDWADFSSLTLFSLLSRCRVSRRVRRGCGRRASCRRGGCATSPCRWPRPWQRPPRWPSTPLRAA